MIRQDEGAYMPLCLRNTYRMVVVCVVAAIIGCDVTAATAEPKCPPRLLARDGFVVPDAAASNDDESVPLEACTRPGTIKVTPRALERAAPFNAALPAGWIVVFSWYDGQRMRASKDAPWVDMGPGVDFGADKISQIPKEAIYHEGSFPYAVLMRKDIVDNHPEKTIDLDAGGHLTLR